MRGAKKARLFRRSADESRHRLKLFKIFTDGDHFGQDRTIVQLKRWQLAHGILGAEGFPPILAAQDIDGHLVERDTLFGREGANDLRIGALAVIEFHRVRAPLVVELEP